MGANSFNEMEIDAIGEIMNISLGASATAVSTLLGAKVNITTPVVQIQTKQEFEFKRLEPAVGVEISYTEGLEGKNIMVFRRDDVRIIVGMMIGQEISQEDFQMDDINISAICEVMNQMMGSSSTAMSEFLGRTVNISTPLSSEITDTESFKESYFAEESSMVIVRFQLEIVGTLKSEFINMIPIPLAKHLLVPFKDTIVAAEKNAESEIRTAAELKMAETEQEKQRAAEEKMESSKEEATEAHQTEASEPAQEGPDVANKEAESPSVTKVHMKAETPKETEAFAAVGQSAQPGTAWMPQPGMQPPVYGYPAPGDPAVLQLLAQMQQTQVQMMELMKNMGKEGKTAQSSSIIRPVNSPQLVGDMDEGEEEKANQEMLMGVPLEVSVEIGRTKKLVRDILEFTQGTLVVLDKMAGEQVDLFVNGQCIARGDIVVVEDNFGIRVTEIVSNGLNAETLQ